MPLNNSFQPTRFAARLKRLPLGGSITDLHWLALKLA